LEATLKVCFLNRNPTTHVGGDLIMLARLMSALQKLGVECENIYGEWGPETLHRFDVIHLQHCNLSWAKENWWKTLASRRPYVVLPIFYPTDQLGMTYDEMRSMFENASAVCPLSFREAREIRELTGFSGPFHIIPHGTEERFHWHDSREGGGFVMCANARGQKGEAAVERACKRLQLPFRYVTGVPHEKLHLVYRQAKVFVHSSPDDRMSLTVGEALCSGCRVISSDRDRGNEWFPWLKACNPESEEDLFQWIGMAWRSEQWDWRPNEQARLMTWEAAARKWLRVYEGALR
jgi:glycosyltransferase involved in cell wall biosynthesis